jgi:deazaflavin-dependent oxidoreductase (nitroreductase family)
VTDSPVPWVARHIRAYVSTDGRRGHTFNGHPALLITTIGRKTGKLRRTAAYYGRDGSRCILVASDGGAPTDPSWYLNLVANPTVHIQVGAATFLAHARTATPAERPRLWRLMTAIFPKYADYQAKAGRDIPVVILEPLEEKE